MGNSQSEKEKIKQTVMNDTTIQAQLKKVNDTINKTVVEQINKVSDEMESSSRVAQEQTSGMTVFGGTVEKGAKVDMSMSQELDMQESINISSIQNVKQDSQIVSDLQKQLSMDLQKSLSAQQDAQQSDGEQAMREMMGALTGAVDSAMQALNFGGSKSSEKDIETEIKNFLNISNKTEIINKTKNIMESKMITETLSKLKTSLDVFQKQSKDGYLITPDAIFGEDSVTDFSMKQKAKITRDVVMQKLNDTGMGTTILSKLLEVDDTKMKESIDAAQKAEEESVGTFEGAGRGVASAAKGVGEGVSTGAQGIGSGISSAMQGMMMPMIVIAVVAIVGLFVLKPMLEKIDGDDLTNMVGTATGNAPMGNAPMMGGSKKIKKMMKNFSSLFSPFYKKMKPYFTFKNLNIILGLVVVYQFIVFFISYFKKENFTDDQVNKNYYVKIGDKYLKRKDGKIELIDNKNEASLVSIIKIKDKIYLKFGKQFAITNFAKKLKIMKNIPVFYSSQKIEYNKNKKSLKIGKNFLNLEEGKLTLSDNDKFVKVQFEE